MKAVIFGLGSIGQRHARLIKDNFSCELVAFRSGAGKEGNVLGIKEISSFSELDQFNPDAAFITNPTDMHLEYAIPCAKRGISLFIEKPLSNSIEMVPELAEQAKITGAETYVAYCLRFHSVIKWIKNHLEERTSNHEMRNNDLRNKPLHVSVYASSYLPSWRSNVNHLEHYSAKKERGGGVVFELSHEIDYLHHLFGEAQNIEVNSGRLSEVTYDAEDYIDMILSYGKLKATVHIDFMSHLNRREVIIDFIDHTVIGDLVNGTIIQIGPGKEKVTYEFDYQKDNMYKEQLEYFFGLVEERKKRLSLRDNVVAEKGKKIRINDLEEASRILETIIKIRRIGGLE
jgi:predicted dehydrogenase